MSHLDTYETELSFQADRRKAAVAFIKIASDLWYDKSIELVLFRNQLIDRNVSEILDLHEYAGAFVEKPISIFDSVEIAEAIKTLELPPAKLDIGKLTYEYHLEEDHISATSFVAKKLKPAKATTNITPKDVVLYGFGRIGRLLARELMTRTGKGAQMRLRAIVTRGKIDATVLEKRASLLKSDSVHGDFANTGAFRDKEALSRHLAGKGVAKVLLTAPGKGIPNIVHGVNHLEHNPDETSIFSAASCTTNAITPVLKAMDDSFGVKYGHLETIHAYTNDQNLVDNMHSKYRRGRAAALNMVITETGAGKAVSKALPTFEGKLTSNAIRVPVPNGSLAILNLELDKETSVEDLNTTLRKYALEGNLVEQIKYSIDNELVSSDIVGSSAPSIYDSNATIVREGGFKRTKSYFQTYLS